MGRFAKFLVVLLIAAVGVGALAAQVIPFEGQDRGRPAGCHEHGSKAPAPTRYQCCLTGHNAGVPQPAYSPEPLFHQAQSEPLIEPSHNPITLIGVETPALSSGDPPGATPLRI